MIQKSGMSISNVEIGKRISNLRRKKGLSQEEVATNLSVSRPTLVSIEKGTRPAKPEELLQLSRILGSSIHELVSIRPVLDEFAPLFRGIEVHGIGSGSELEAVDVFQKLCEDYLMLEELLGAPMPRFVYPEPIDVSTVPPSIASEEIANMERSRLNLGMGPIPNLLEILESDVGLRVFVLPISNFQIAGMFAYTDKLGGCILVNGSHPYTRQNWSLAHEYAHFLMDRFKDDITSLVDFSRKPTVEKIADGFAASFLMPSAGLRQRFNRVIQSRNDFTVADLCLLADQYAVSVEAMTYRLESIACLPGQTWTNLKSAGFNGSTVRKGLGLNTPISHKRRLPKRYIRLSVQAFENDLIGESELSRLLRCSRVEAREIVNSLTHPSEIGETGEQYELELSYGSSLPLVQAGGR